MLPRSVEQSTLDILIQLQDLPELKDFYLVGGTALALKYDHRLSIDLDLFATKEFDPQKVIDSITKAFPNSSYRDETNSIGIFFTINDVKVDLIKHHYFALISEPQFINNVRMFSDPDIIAMKVFAILKRAKKKDFYDMAELLQHYTVEDVIGFYKKKYPNNQVAISIPVALTYFADAEEDEDPVSLKKRSWFDVKKIIQSKVNRFFR